MPVRGSTAWQHARVEKKIINRDEGGDGRVTSSGTHYTLCAWSDCDHDGLELYKIQIDQAKNRNEPRFMNYVFCSERHKEYWIDEFRRNRV